MLVTSSFGSPLLGPPWQPEKGKRLPAVVAEDDGLLELKLRCFWPENNQAGLRLGEIDQNDMI